MKTKVISEFYEQCYQFNQVAGKLDNVKIQDIYNQLLLIKEELDEAFHAYQTEDAEGILDAHCDLSVVVAGLGFILKELGFKVEDALLETSKNNLTKFIAGEDSEKVSATIAMLAEQGVEARMFYNKENDLIVIKDNNNKIRKPVGFVSNSLIKFVPKEFV